MTHNRDCALIYLGSFCVENRFEGVRAFARASSAKEWVAEKANEDLEDQWLHDTVEGA